MTNFNTFEDVQNTLLRSYNRAVFAVNLIEDGQNDACKEYIGSFSKAEQLAISAILIALRKFGSEETLREVMKRVHEEDKETVH